MTLRYTNRPVGYAPQRQADWRQRFPANAEPIETAPMMGSRPVRVFSADGKSQWAIRHGDSWKTVSSVLDADGVRRSRMDGGTITGVMWASS